MKKVIFIVLIACVAFVGCQAKKAEAVERRHHKKTAVVQEANDHNVLGVKLDAPNLVNIDKEGQWTLGVEGGKEVIKELFYGTSYVEADKGYFAYVKVTYKGCLLNCKEE